MDWMTAAEALAVLGTQPQTLYANVSRGRIKAKPDPGDSRRSLYRGDDVRRLAQRRPGRKTQEAVAAEAISWGEPVLRTSISTVAAGRLIYRGRFATELAQHGSLEDTAALLWQRRAVTTPKGVAEAPSLRAALLALAERVAIDPPSFGRSAVVLGGEAEAVWGSVALALAGGGKAGEPVHQRLARAWRRPEAAELIRQTLVLLADHELNASAFAARVTASTGASLAAAVLAGLGALTGPLHGSAAVGAQLLVRDTDAIGAEAAVLARLGQGVSLPAFGHQLYPDGDERAAYLLAQFKVPPVYQAVGEAAARITGDLPNIDFALAAITGAFKLPLDAPLLLFALARTVGWLAHAQEQISAGALIRPRAIYETAADGRQ